MLIGDVVIAVVVVGVGVVGVELWVNIEPSDLRLVISVGFLLTTEA